MLLLTELVLFSLIVLETFRPYGTQEARVNQRIPGAPEERNVYNHIPKIIREPQRGEMFSA